MYHTTDTYLNRVVTTVDEVGNNEIVDEVICQDCHLKEKWVGKEVKTNKPCFIHLNEFKLVVDSIEMLDVKYPITVKIGDTDSYEWFDEDELELVVENIANYIEEKAESRGWENAEYMAADKFGVDKTLETIEWMDKNDPASKL